MKRIYLDKNDKIALRCIAQQGNKKPVSLSNEEYYLSVVSLKEKSLVIPVFAQDIEIVDVRLTPIGFSYLCSNPSLYNPIDWYKVVTTISVIITAIATTVALWASSKLIL